MSLNAVKNFLQSEKIFFTITTDFFTLIINYLIYGYIHVLSSLSLSREGNKNEIIQTEFS